MKPMSIAQSLLATGFVTCLVLAGCKKQEPVEENKEDVQAAQTEKPKVEEETTVAALPLAPEQPTTTVEGVPTAEDFEEEAAKTLAPDNLEAELDRLESEILAEENEG